jgi:small subunit ribosomal protein S6
MALYESTFISNQELTEKQVDGLVQDFSDFLKHQGAKLIKKEYWGIRNFAYEIKKQKKGHYVMMCLDATPEALKSLEKKIKSQEEILKYFNVKVKNFVEKTSMLEKVEEDNN